MALGMRGESPGPGRQHAPQTELSAEVFGVQGESRHSGSGGWQEQGGEAFVVRAGDRPQCLGQGKGDKQRGHGEKPLTWRVPPPGGRMVVALWAMPMLAGMITVLQRTAIGALVDMTAKRCGTAVCNGRQGCQVALGPPVADAGTGGGAMPPADVGQLDPGSPRETLSGRA
jgi:hypothetical protein